MRQVKIIMHTHWDREWYFTKDETKVYLLNHMREVVEFLEINKDVKYILDGQSVMIDDFLLFAPHYEERLRSLVANGQLLVGPWYTQTDLMIVHGEMIIQNLYYGIKRAREFGQPMLNGYAPDTFGHNAQMPQIYKQFGIDNTLFWRGFSEMHASKSDFMWEGADGSCIYGINLATGYQGAKYLESDEKELEERMDKIYRVLDHYSASDSRLIMNGHDQMPIQSNIHDIVSKLKKIYPEDEVSIATFDDYINDVKQKELEVVGGELVHAKHARIHKTINSTRMDIKLLNNYLERKIFNYLEPLLVKAATMGMEYPHSLMEYVYKVLFGVHAHDSIGGCNSDMVNEDIRIELLRVQTIVENQIDVTLRLIALSTVSEKNIVVFNQLPYKRENVSFEVEIFTDNRDFKLLDNGVEVSYQILSQEQTDAGLIDRQIAARLKDITIYRTIALVNINSIDGFELRELELIENEVRSSITSTQKAIVNLEDNKLVLSHKEVVITDFIKIINSGDAGDSYDYSPPVKDLVLDVNDIKLIKEVIENNIVIQTYELEAKLPKNLEERNEEICSTMQKFTLVVTTNDDEITVKINTINVLDDSRFRVAFNTECNDEMVNCDMQLCDYNRPIYAVQELAVWEEDNWVEKPVSIETCNSFVKYGDFTIATEGFKEYEVADGFVYFTLFRSFSHLGKRNLVNRPGRPSGIEIETPDNQLNNVAFKCIFHIKLGKCNAHNFAKEKLSSVMAYQLKQYNRFNINKNIDIIDNKATMNFEFNGCVISSIRNTEDNNIAIRLFNPNNEIATINFTNNVFLSNMFGEKLAAITTLDVKYNEFVTIVMEQK